MKGTEESTLGKDSLVPRMHHDASDVGFSKETQNAFSDLRILSWVFLKKRTQVSVLHRVVYVGVLGLKFIQ